MMTYSGVDNPLSWTSRKSGVLMGVSVGRGVLVGLGRGVWVGVGVEVVVGVWVGSGACTMTGSQMLGVRTCGEALTGKLALRVLISMTTITAPSRMMANLVLCLCCIGFTDLTTVHGWSA